MSGGKTEARELRLERVLDAPREAVWRCWTEAALLPSWFAPEPWTTEVREMDVRPGGAMHTVMRGPEGEESGGVGVYLDVVPNERLVFTDAFTPGWVPADGTPFMVAIIELSDAGRGKTRYVARARHWTEEKKKEHEAMGFHEGWGQVADQLEAAAKAL